MTESMIPCSSTQIDVNSDDQIDAVRQPDVPPNFPAPDPSIPNFQRTSAWVASQNQPSTIFPQLTPPFPFGPQWFNPCLPLPSIQTLMNQEIIPERPPLEEPSMSIPVSNPPQWFPLPMRLPQDETSLPWYRLTNAQKELMDPRRNKQEKIHQNKRLRKTNTLRRYSKGVVTPRFTAQTSRLNEYEVTRYLLICYFVFQRTINELKDQNPLSHMPPVHPKLQNDVDNYRYEDLIWDEQARKDRYTSIVSPTPILEPNLPK